MSKYRTWFLIALLGVSGYLAATPSAPAELSLRGIVDWAIRGGHIASSTGAVPSVGTLGERYTDLSNPFRPVEKRSDGAAWRALWTWDHALLTHLLYAESGHGIVPVTHGGTGASSAAGARTNLSVYSKSETDDAIVGSVGLLRYYVQQASTGSDISGYGYLQTYANPVNGASASYDIFYMTPMQLFAEVSASGTPEITVSKAGVYPCFLTGARSGLLDVALLATAWKRTVAGVETQIASSAWVTVATSSSALISLPMTAGSEVVWSPTDRVVFKLYGERTGGFIGTSTLSLYFGESYPSYFTFNVGREGAYARRDLSNVAAPYLDFATSTAAPAYREGRVFWDKDNGCLALYPEVSDPILQIGQENWVRVKNAEVATMTNGQVVYLTPPGAGKDPIAKLARADSKITSPIIGVITHDIPPDGSGYATTMGLVRDLHTQGMTEGSKVYLSASTAGSFTTTLPAPPNYSLLVGYVLKAHATAGVIYVRTNLNGSLDGAVFGDYVYFTATPTVNGLRVALASDVDGLSGVTNAAAARANIDVYSTTQVDEKIPNNASFSFDLLSDSPDYTGNGGKVLALNGGGTALEWVSVPGIGSLSHAGLSDLDFESSGHTGFTGATETASITSTLQAVMASVSAELDPANYQENYDIMASASALIAPLSGRTYVGIQNIDELKSIHIYPNGLVASSGPANLVLYAGEVWYQRLTDSVPVAFYASEATPIVIFQGK